MAAAPLAVKAPRSKNELSDIDGLPEKTARRVGDSLVRIVSEASADDGGYKPPSRPDETQKAALKRMQQYVASVADGLGLAAELIAPRKELSAAMQGERNLRVFSGWRQELVGGELLGLLEG